MMDVSCLLVAPNRIIFSRWLWISSSFFLFKMNFCRREQVPEMKKIFPNMQLDFIHCGHLVHLEKPNEFMESVVRFLNN